MTNPSTNLEAGVIIRRSLFFLVLIALTLVNLFTLFRGLNSPAAMDQAQIAREITRGNGFTTKFIRPAAYERAATSQESTIPFVGFQDTYHSPLNPLLNAAIFKVIGADDTEKWKMAPGERIFPLDRVIATVSTLCFLLSIGVFYLLVTRIFDPKIAAVTAILMLLCNTFWDYSLSGLPQMLMLLLFGCALYFAYRAVENSAEGRVPFASALIAGVFFTLLAMTHYLAVWIALGYIIYAAIFFRPRGLVGLTALVILIVPSIFIFVRNIGFDGGPFGSAFLNLYNGIGGDREDIAMRTLDREAYPLIGKGIFTSIIRTTLIQTTSIIPFLAGIIVAPLFFLSLLHPFRKESIANFRWLILIMFGLCAFGLAIYGISDEHLDPNQIHMLFAPIMTAYGIAILSILWTKIPSIASNPPLRNVHLFVVVAICGLPLLLGLPQKVKRGIENNSGGGIPHWPPYWAPALNLDLNKYLEENEISFSDQPWAVAWYADRISVWLPMKKEAFLQIEENAESLETPITGILISPSSHGSGDVNEVAMKYGDFAAIVLDGNVIKATYPSSVSIFDKNERIQDITNRFPFRAMLVGFDMMYYAKRNLNPDSRN